MYEAHDPHLERLVALKLIRISARHSLPPSEEQALGRLSHPNVVGVYDVNHTPDGRPYIICEYLEGEPLSGYLEREGAIPILKARILEEKTLEWLLESADLRVIEPGARSQGVRALVPQSELSKYATTLRSLSQGRAIHTRRFHAFEELPQGGVQKGIEAVKKEREEELAVAP